MGEKIYLNYNQSQIEQSQIPVLSQKSPLFSLVGERIKGEAQASLNLNDKAIVHIRNPETNEVGLLSVKTDLLKNNLGITEEEIKSTSKSTLDESIDSMTQLIVQKYYDAGLNAIKTKDIKALETILGSSFPVNTENQDKLTLLVWAISYYMETQENAYLKAIEVLFDHGADPNLVSEMGPLYFFCLNYSLPKNEELWNIFPSNKIDLEIAIGNQTALDYFTEDLIQQFKDDPKFDEDYKFKNFENLIEIAKAPKSVPAHLKKNLDDSLIAEELEKSGSKSLILKGIKLAIQFKQIPDQIKDNKNSINEVKKAIQEGLSIKKTGSIILEQAILNENTELFKFVIENGGILDATHFSLIASKSENFFEEIRPSIGCVPLMKEKNFNDIVVKATSLNNWALIDCLLEKKSNIYGYVAQEGEKKLIKDCDFTNSKYAASIKQRLDEFFEMINSIKRNETNQIIDFLNKGFDIKSDLNPQGNKLIDLVLKEGKETVLKAILERNPEIINNAFFSSLSLSNVNPKVASLIIREITLQIKKGDVKENIKKMDYRVVRFILDASVKMQIPGNEEIIRLHQILQIFDHSEINFSHSAQIIKAILNVFDPILFIAILSSNSSFLSDIQAFVASLPNEIKQTMIDLAPEEIKDSLSSGVQKRDLSSLVSNRSVAKNGIEQRWLEQPALEVLSQKFGGQLEHVTNSNKVLIDAILVGLNSDNETVQAKATEFLLQFSPLFLEEMMFIFNEKQLKNFFVHTPIELIDAFVAYLSEEQKGLLSQIEEDLWPHLEEMQSKNANLSLYLANLGVKFIKKGVQRELVVQIINALNNKEIIKDREKLKKVNKALHAMLKDDKITPDDHKKIFAKIILGLQEGDFTVKDAASYIISQMSFINFLIISNEYNHLQDFLLSKEKQVERIYEKIFIGKFNLSPVEVQGFNKTGGLENVLKLRNPEYFIIYQNKIEDLESEEQRIKMKSAFKEFFLSVAEGNYLEKRYNEWASPEFCKFLKDNKIESEWKESYQLDLEASESVANVSKNFSYLNNFINVIIEHKHLDISAYPHLYQVFSEGKKLTEVRNELLNQIKQEKNKEKRAILQFESNCLALCALTTDRSQEIKKLSDIAAFLIKNKNTEFLEDIKRLQQRLTEQSTISVLNKYELKESDDPFDIFVIGTDVTGSCQNIEGNPQLNKGLLGYIMSPANRVLEIKAKDSGKMIARRLMRLVKDENDKPALFLEPLYPAGAPDWMEENILELAKKKALAMKVPLYRDNSGDSEKVQNKALNSFKCEKAPFEYFDSASGIQTEAVKITKYKKV